MQSFCPCKKDLTESKSPYIEVSEAERRKHRQPRQIRKEAAVTVATGVQLLFFACAQAPVC